MLEWLAFVLAADPADEEWLRREARAAAVRAGLARLDEIAASLTRLGEIAASGELAGPAPAGRFRQQSLAADDAALQVRREVIGAQRGELLRWRDAGLLSDAGLRVLQRELDHEER